MTNPGQPGARPPYVEYLRPQDYAGAVWRAKWLILALGLTGLAAAAAFVQFFPAQYVSKAVVRFIPPKVSEKYVPTGGDSWVEQRTLALAQTLASSLTARKMVEGAGLYPELRRFQTSADLAPRFQEALTVRSVTPRGPSGRSPVATIEIGFRYSDPGVAKQVVQQLVESVFETNERYRGDQSQGTAQFLTEQAETARERLAELEDELGQLGKPDRIAGDHQWALKIQQLYSVENRLGHVQSSLRSLRRDLADKLEEILVAEGELSRVGAAYTAVSEPRTLEAMRLQMSCNEAELRLELLSKRYRPDHPDVQEAKIVLRDLQQRLEEQVARDVDSARARARRQIQNRLDLLRSDRDSLSAAIRAQEAEEAQLARRAGELRALATPTSESDTEYLRLMREYTSAGEHYKLLFRKERESQLAAEVDRLGQGETVELLDPPTVATKPEFPSNPVRMALGAVMGLGAGVLVALMRYHLRPTLSGAHHLVYWQGVTLLADLPAGMIEDGRRGSGVGKRRWTPRLTGVSGLLVVVMAAGGMLAGCKTDPGKIRDSWLAAAAKAEQSRDISGAIRCYQLAVQADARSAAGHTGLARVLLATGEIEAALAHLIRKAELRPDDYEAQAELAGVFYKIYHSEPGRSSSTLYELEAQAGKLIGRWPSKAEGYRAMSLVLCERGRPAEAAKLLEEGLRLTGGSAQVGVELASVLYRLGEKERAEELLRGLIQREGRCAQAYDLLYLQLRDRRMVEAAEDVLQWKWARVGDADAGLQYAAHLESVGRRAAMIAQVEEVERRLDGQSPAMAMIGAFWQSRGESERAQAVYGRAAARFPSERNEFLGRWSEIAAGQGQREQALAAIEDALKKTPGDSTLEAYRAALNLDSGAPGAAKAAKLQLEQLLKRMPSSAFVRFHLGRSYLRAGDVFKAGLELERSIRIDPNYAPGWLALAESEYRMGHLARSRGTLNKLLVRAPRYAPALLLKARVEGELGKVKEVERTLDLAAQAGAPAQAVAVERARLLMGAGDFDAAARMLRATAAAAGHEPAVAIALASAEAARGSVEAALTALETAATAHPGAAELAVAKAYLLLRAGRYTEAAGAFTRLAAESPDSPAMAAGLADSLAMSGRLKEAAPHYERAMRLPGAAPSVWVSAGALYSALGDRERAERCYQAALAKDGSNPVALNNLAYLLGRAGKNLEYALQLAQSAGAMLPGSDEALDTLLYVTLKLGYKQQALEILEKAAARSGTASKSWYRSLKAELAEGTAGAVLRRLEEAQKGRKAT